MKTLIFAMLLSLTQHIAALPVIIDFDDLATGTFVDRYYESQGVTFINAITNRYGALDGASEPNTIGHSIFGTRPQMDSPIEALFTLPVTYVGLTGIDVERNGFVLSAYDSHDGGNLIAQSTTFNGQNTKPLFAKLELHASNIKRITFSQINNSYEDGVVFDNLTFDTVALVVGEPTHLFLFSFLILAILRHRIRRDHHRSSAS